MENYHVIGLVGEGSFGKVSSLYGQCIPHHFVFWEFLKRVKRSRRSGHEFLMQ